MYVMVQQLDYFVRISNREADDDKLSSCQLSVHLPCMLSEALQAYI